MHKSSSVKCVTSLLPCMLVCVSISKRDEQRRRFFGWNETRQSTVVKVPVVPVSP